MFYNTDRVVQLTCTETQEPEKLALEERRRKMQEENK
jgi:hypothetical protein